MGEESGIPEDSWRVEGYDFFVPTWTKDRNFSPGWYYQLGLKILMDRQWMYADRRSKEFIDGVHYFLRVAEANRQRGFICCPCNNCKNQKEYSASRTIHFHLFESGFMPSYNCWTSHGEQGVEMEEDEVEDEYIPDFAQYVGFEENQTGEEEIAADGNVVADDLGQMLQDAREDCESEKEAHKLDKMLEDHRTSLYPGCEHGYKKLDTTLEFLQWKAKNGVSDKAFGDLLTLVKNILPGGKKLHETRPKQPGNDIDVYLRPLVEDLKQLWKKEGVPVWDEDKQEEFNLRALLFVTINDWPALSNLSGQSNKGYKACTHCMDETESTYLKHCRKVVYMGHRRFLAANHPVRKKGKHFEHKADHCTKPKHRSEKTVFTMVKDLKVVFRKGPGSQPIESEDGHAAMWKKNPIFWELPYWEFLDVRHAIDVMHLTKNLCINLLGFLGVYGKSKDTLEARNDLKHMEQRGDLHPEPKEKGSHYLSPASYTLSKAEKESMFECLESIKVPSGYSTNIKRIISTKEKKFTNLKSHDCHVLMTQLLPVVIRAILPDNVRATITKLRCIHERNFAEEFIEDLRPIGVPESRHEGRLRGKGTLGRKAIMTVDNNLFRKSHFTVLQQSSLVAPYIEEHLALVHARNIDKSDAWITRHHIVTFPAWLRQHLMGNETINQQLAFLARGPFGSIVTFQGYGNQNTFYTRAQDMKSTNQNSAVRIDAMEHDGTTGTYYGAIEEIWELDYGPLKVPLFRYQWVRLTGGGVTIDDSGMTTVDLNKVGYSDKPFVLANDVTQVFFVKDMSSKEKKGRGPDEPKRQVVLPGKRKIVGVEDKTDEDYDQLDGQPPFTVTIDPSILLSNEDTPYSRSDHKEGTIVRRKYMRSTVTADVMP
uniref:OSJNBb0076A11.7 protein n=1 Tax=Oryza sativa subsp. japonica TaxID=39947 RepID=Q7XMN5_ORYSJ|nr:OSJNBb0076A11.7 [Oryza sativa Japonica Group]